MLKQRDTSGLENYWLVYIPTVRVRKNLPFPFLAVPFSCSFRFVFVPFSFRSTIVNTLVAPRAFCLFPCWVWPGTRCVISIIARA